MTFTTGLIIGTITSCIAYAVALFIEFSRVQDEIEDAYNIGFEEGREWKDHERERAESQIAEIKEKIGELQRDKLKV